MKQSLEDRDNLIGQAAIKKKPHLYKINLQELKTIQT